MVPRAAVRPARLLSAAATARFGAALVAAAAALATPAAHAGSPRLCERPVAADTGQQHGRLLLAARLRQELQAAGAPAALLSRSGVELGRFAQRYSHAGVTLQASPQAPWAVRQLYYACDESRPRLFDQGLAGFLLAADDQPVAHVSLLLLPPPAAQALAEAALHPTLPLQLLAARYSANAHPFATRYQNCNQWLAELLAVALGELGPETTREQAQGWLAAQGYEPHRFEVRPSVLMVAAWLMPMLHRDDHPQADLDDAVFRVSMPASIEAFVQRRLPQTRRIELCQDSRHVLLRRDGAPLDAACTPGPGDEVWPLH